jgi:hypothetical protein
MSEVDKKINECVKEIMSYRSYAASEVDRIVNSLKEIKNFIHDFTEENEEKAKKMVSRLYLEVASYSSYIPTTVNNLKSIKDWLEKATK